MCANPPGAAAALPATHARAHTAGEGPEAPQPPGLTVTLRPHQRQSLRRMLDLEATPGGFAGVLWRRFEAGGRPMWASLALRRLSLAPPPWAPAGGILGAARRVLGGRASPRGHRRTSLTPREAL